MEHRQNQASDSSSIQLGPLLTHGIPVAVCTLGVLLSQLAIEKGDNSIIRLVETMLTFIISRIICRLSREASLNPSLEGKGYLTVGYGDSGGRFHIYSSCDKNRTLMLGSSNYSRRGNRSTYHVAQLSGVNHIFFKHRESMRYENNN